MKVFYNSSFTGHYPVGTSAIVVDESRAKARNQLEKSLKLIGLPQRVEVSNMVEIDLDKRNTIILQNGNY